MNERTVNSYSAEPKTNKTGIALRYKVGVRTIENWLRWGILSGRMERGEILMNIPDCDARLMQHKERKPNKDRGPQQMRTAQGGRVAKKTKANLNLKGAII
jgi:hypothetical protein